jgi:hypothetical protein
MEHEEDGRADARVRTHPHPIHFAGAAGWTASVALIATLLIRHNDLAASTDWAIAGGGLVLALTGFVRPTARWMRTWVELDDAVARCTAGLLRQSSVAVDLGRARALGIDRGFLGRWLGYGRLRVVDEHGTTHLFPPLGEAALRTAVAQRERRTRGRRGDPPAP